MTTEKTHWKSEFKQLPSDLPRLQQWMKQLQQFSQRFVSRLTTSEPIVRQSRDRKGYVWWYVYDPKTEQRAYLASEEEVLLWLEERYRYHPPATHWTALNLHRSQLFR
ncbi:MAG TPA: hypothetical protein V6D14_15430 [Coleofasciculaceae cyanobacterium]|jgi:hypothetical protein